MTRVGLAALLQFRMTEDIVALREALELQRALVEASALDAVQRMALLMAMAGNLVELYGYTKVPAVLDEAVAMGQMALRLVPAGHFRQQVIVSTIGEALLKRFRATGDIAALDQAIRSYRDVQATAGEPVDSNARAARAEFYDGLGQCLRHRYLATGDTVNLHEAVGAAREAVAVVAADDPYRGEYLHNLGEALGCAATRWEDLDKLDETIMIHRAAVEAARSTSRNLDRYLIRLSNAFHERFRARPDVPAHLEQAHRAAVAAVSVARDSDPGTRHNALHNLRVVLATMRRLDEIAGKAADARLQGLLSAAKPAFEHDVVAATRDRDAARRRLAHHHMSPADLAELVRLGRRAAESAPTGSPVRAALLCSIGMALRERADRFGDPADRRAATSAFAEVAGTSAADLLVRAGAALEHTRLAADGEDWPEAAAAYQLLIELLPNFARQDLQRADQEHRVRSIASVGSDAAACALRGGLDAATALGLLERGRGILLNRAMQARTGLTVVDSQPINPAEFTGMASDGPIVVVNASRYGCHAFVVSQTDITAVQLPDLSREDVVDRADAFAVALQVSGGGHDPEHAWAASRHVDDTLGWLWDTVAEPVLAAIGIVSAAEPTVTSTRLWWMPVGPLSLLPLHAAGHHRDGSSRNVLDLAISSYTPTLHALWHARATWTGRRAVERATAVATPQVAERAELAHAEQEAGLVRQLFPDARLLSGPRASAADTIPALSESDWVHFACHADSDPQAVWSSQLLLSDRALPVSEIAAVRNPGGYLAYLSACNTARTGTDATDETIHISSAFQLAGYAHVIGTLWTVEDDIAFRIAADVYEAFHSDPHRWAPAHAVHQAVRRLRDQYPMSPLLWASHVHAGP
jgi:tetratricopeptide (TPR) repeat protein